MAEEQREEIAGFVPGRPEAAEGPLARYRPPVPAGAVAEYVRQLTPPGAVVLDLFCQGPTYVREVVQMGRRAIGANGNPIHLLIAGLGLEGVPPGLEAALTRLADTSKDIGARNTSTARRSVPLYRHILSLYGSRCPACREDGTAEWFAWDREGRYPYAKAVRCPRCGRVQEGPADEADMMTARRLDRRGFAYYFSLDRVAPPGHPQRTRAGELVDLYTPRNLSALMDVLIRLEGLDLERPLRAALQGALLETMDRASSLDPHEEERPRPRILRPPARFLERNVWFLLEETVARMARAGGHPPVRRAAGLKALLSDPTPAYTLLPLPARDLGRHIPSGTVSLILADPPRPDGVFWALSALWAGWLWDSPAAQALRPLLGRRRLEWDWHQEALQAALAAVAPLLTPAAHLVLLFAESDDHLIASACQAASAAGYELVHWGASPEVGCRLVWRWRGPKRPEATPVPSPDDIAAAAAETIREILGARAEPTSRAVLSAAVHTELARRYPHAPFSEIIHGARRGGESLELEVPDADLFWLPALDDSRDLPPPLSDRVEETVRALLMARSTWTTEDLLRAVYRALSGPLTPDPSFVLLCIRSYGVEEAGVWRLREEDDPARREEEQESLRRDLEELGRRLGFRPARGRGWDVRWRERKQDVYLFRLSVTAALGTLLAPRPSIPRGGRPCLVIPGGRAELLAEKLRRDPRLARAIRAAGWQFVKFRHLRRLIAEGVSRQAFAAMLGLDPTTGPRGVQIPLW